MNDKKAIPLFVAIIPLVILISLLSLNVYIYKDDAVSGSNQIILIVSAAIAAGLAWLYGSSWKTLEGGVINSLKLASPAILILLMVGALSGTWLLSGIIPTMIYYGLQVLNATLFLFAACIICAVVSVFTGSSWTTSATIGIALMGIGKVLGLHEGMIAGAILSGAYFGDKLSPLSDTTNLASASSGTELFTHIRYLTITTVPSILISLTLFVALGFGAKDTAENVGVDEILTTLNAQFNITPWLLLVPIAVLAMILKKVPALPALFAGTVLGGIFAFIFQPDIVEQMGAASGSEDFHNYIGIMQAAFGDTQLQTGNDTLDELLSSSGMAGMMGTIWLIISAMIFGGVMESSGFLRIITESVIRNVRSAGSLVAATAGTCMFTNVSASDQYLAVLVPGRMFADSYKQRGLASQNLSRTLEDSGTVTSVLVPWNTCGAYHAGVLGVATLTYAPFAFFCILSPIITIAFAYIGFKVARTSDNEVIQTTSSQPVSKESDKPVSA
ncbi:Na+/H+ antiporter NhaC [Marinibactrum halimedae]|uniref:Sodium:proton antiporter n=1 Tax=Marinibactrum halimedae TaxID=1444977 RepID=A0AA37T628_9GAMM|nr:Na+/H+ antiporter NhaC [Marinibactrum halimedae]MCD9460180.1 Na+/H+ antiporter NhaC [Marinibactrum halimedae]GLS26349.1 sodium:proton antiporter [Marinibactrum halimedae]